MTKMAPSCRADRLTDLKAQLTGSTGCAASAFLKSPQRLLGQHGVAIFPDFLDLAVLQAEHQTIIVVVAHAFLGEVIALCLDHDVVAVGNETMRNGARPID